MLTRQSLCTEDSNDDIRGGGLLGYEGPAQPTLEPRSVGAYLLLLCRALVDSPVFRVHGPTEGYRCKMTYSLYPRYMSSPLGMPGVNALSDVVNAFVLQTRCSTLHPPWGGLYQRHPRFLWEVCVKVSRRDEYMIKLSLINEPCPPVAGASVVDSGDPAGGLFAEWCASGEKERFVAFVCERFHGNIVAIIAHVGAGRKPGKTDPYISVYASTPTASSRASRPSGDFVGTAYAMEAGIDSTPHGAPHTTRGEDTIVEYTPNGIPFVMSADSFCEVNHRMEDAMYTATVEFLRLDTVAREPPATVRNCGRRIFIAGRDVNSVVTTFAHMFAGVTAVTSCPRVFQDTVFNGIRGLCSLAAKDELWLHLRRFRLGQSGTDAAVQQPAQVLLTAGRHGLHPSTCFELVRFAQQAHGSGSGVSCLTDLLYVSCNVESLGRDLLILKEGFVVSNVRTFDFFPGTAYVMTILHLTPIDPSGSADDGLLVLPVGPPGIGKSTTGRYIAALLNSVGTPCGSRSEPGNDGRAPKRDREPQSGTQCRAQALPQALGDGAGKSEPVEVESRKRVLCCPASSAKQPFIPRCFTAFTSSWNVQVIERDEVFRCAKEAGLTLRQAKQHTHQVLLNALTRPSSGGVEKAELRRRAILYLDSTNGSEEARDLYLTTWNGRGLGMQVYFSPPAPIGVAPAPLPEDIFSGSEDLLLGRVQHRSGHPSFPADPKAQQDKVKAILAALGSAPVAPMSLEIRHRCLRACVPNGDTEQQTAERVVLHVLAALVFDAVSVLTRRASSPELGAKSLIWSAIDLMERACGPREVIPSPQGQRT